MPRLVNMINSFRQIHVCRFWLFFLILIVCVPIQIAFAQNYQLAWADEFNDAAVDTSKWEFMIGDGTRYGLPSGWGNNELQYYTQENARVEDGFLVITAMEQQYQGHDYTSTRIRSKGNGDWKYGKFEIRAKMPIGQGLWPAIWMLPTEEVYGGWAASGEIDIMEYLGDDSATVHGTLHYGGSWPDNTHSGSSFTLEKGSFHREFHTFTLIWKEGEIQWLVDGEHYQTQSDWWSSGGEFPAPFDRKFHLLINLAVGGNWPGNPDNTTKFPQELIVDYVRVYKRTTDFHGRNEWVPSRYSLHQNYPNPFNGNTIISYELPKSSGVTLALYNLTGELIDVLVEDQQAPGLHSVRLNTSGLSSGVYIYRLDAGQRQLHRKLVLIN